MKALSASEDVSLARETLIPRAALARNEGNWAEPERAGHATASSATIFVCVTCKSGEGQLGAALLAALSERPLDAKLALRAVECFAVCKRPCTVALASPGKWTYVVGDLKPHAHVDDILAAATRYAASPDGVVPWRERPVSFRKGVISRIPPLVPAL